MHRKTLVNRATRGWLGIGALFVLVLLYSIGNAFAQATDAICAEVKIVIEQKLSLERQAFDAKMVITNGLTDQKLENVVIELQFLDANNGPVTATVDPNAQGASFFYRTDQVSGISSLNGGLIEAKAVANINWLIIPAAGSGGTKPEGAVYYIGAKVTYTLNGVTDTVQVEPEAIVVRPQPELVLDYFLPRDVHADDPFTAETEVAEPFTLGVRIKNQGAGTSRNTRIETAQPKIVENRQGLAINFQILGGYVQDEPAGKSLLLDFGNIESGVSKMGRWSMVTSLAGKFVEFSASFTHADSLGGAVTSLIKQVRAHTLIRDVRVDLPGRDKVRDFLAKDGDIYRVYESDGADTEVQDQSASAQLSVQGNSASLTFNAVTVGFAYARVPDPSRGTQTPAQVSRSDGYLVPAENVWLSKERNEDLSWSYFLNIFDANTTGRYSIGFVAGATQSSIAGMVYKDVNANGMHDAGEPGIAVTQIKLTGTQAETGASELQTAYTDAQGQFSFVNLKAGVYTLVAGVADGLVDGPALAGSAGGSSEAGKISRIELGAGTAATGYLFAKRAAAPQTTDPDRADLQVALGATPATVKAGENATITVTAENFGPDAARTVSVNIELPAGLTVLGTSAAVGSYANGVWSLGDMVKNATAILTLQVQVDAAGAAQDYWVTARIGSPTRDDITSNNSASTLIKVQDMEAVSADQTADQGMRVLGYVGCGADQPCAEQKRQAAQAVLTGYDSTAQIAATAAQFQKSLRSGQFSVLWLSGAFAAELDAGLQEELRAAVLRGASLVIDGQADASLHGIADMWGSYGAQPLAAAALQIDSASIPLALPSWPLEPHASATQLLHYNSGEVAAARAGYGKGQVLVMGFDPFAENINATAWTDWLQAQMALGTPALTEPMLGGSVVHVQTVITNGDSHARQLSLSSALGSDMQLVSAWPAATQTGSQTGNQLSWSLDLAAGAEQTVDLWLRLPADAKAFTLESQLRNSADAAVLHSWSHPVRTVALAQAQSNTRAALAALASLNAGQQTVVATLLDQATAAGQQQKYGDAIHSLLLVQQMLRALPQGAARDAAWQSLAQWIGWVSRSWHDQASTSRNWSLTISAGNQQAAQVQAAFGAALQVRLADENNHPIFGQLVRFTAPASAASVVFGNGTQQMQASTDAQGMAYTDTFWANAEQGAYQVVASVDGADGTAAPVAFDLRNTDPAVSVLTLQSVLGDGQSAPVQQSFTQALQARVLDAQGQGVAGWAVEFTLPAAGASASFAGGLHSVQVFTDANGLATSPVLSANALPGHYQARATAVGVSGEVRFELVNTAAAAPMLNVQIVAGSGQVATVQTAFAQPVRVKLVDAQGVAVAGRSVSFELPASSASASFAAGALTAQATTDAQGMAVSPPFTANATPGDYAMVVHSAGALPVRAGLKNLSVTVDSGKQVVIATPTGTGTVKASVSGGGASCRFNPNKTSVQRAEGLVPQFNVLQFRHGVFSFELIGCTVGGTVTITTEWPDLQGITSYMKYGPTPTSRGRDVWYEPRNLRLQGNQVSYTITDGQLGDDDLTANGIIKDPGGPVIQLGPLPVAAFGDAVPVPGFGPVHSLVLSLLMLLGWGCCQRRPGKRPGAALGCATTRVAHGG